MALDRADASGDARLRVHALLDLARTTVALGDLEEAERVARRGYEEWVAMGDPTRYSSTTVGLLARALCLQGRYDEAEQYVEICERTSGEGDLVNE